MLGQLKKIDLEMIHPDGKIKFYYNKKPDGQFIIKIDLPKALKGEIEINHRTYPLSPGENNFK